MVALELRFFCQATVSKVNNELSPQRNTYDSNHFILQEENGKFIIGISFFCSAKIVIHLHPVPANKEPGPYQHSKYSYIKLSFKEHGQIEVIPLAQVAERAFSLNFLYSLLTLF